MNGKFLDKKKNADVLALRETITPHRHSGKLNITNTVRRIICYSIFSFFIFNFFSWWFNIKWNFWDFYDLSIWFWQLILLNGDNNVQIFISHQILWQGSKIIGFLHSIFHHPIIDKKWWNELFDQAKKWSFIANLSFSINKIGNYLLPIESEIICNVILLTSSPQSDQTNFKTFHTTLIRPMAGDCFSSPEH